MKHHKHLSHQLICGLALLATPLTPNPATAATINANWEGIYYYADTHSYIWPAETPSLQLARSSGSRLSRYYKPHAALEFPIADLTPGTRKLQLTLADDPKDNFDPYFKVPTHELSIRVKPGDGQVTFADFFDITPEMDAQALADGHVENYTLIRDGFPQTFPTQTPIDTIAYQHADASAGTLLHSDTEAFSDALNDLILLGHSHAMVLIRFESVGTTYLATHLNDQFNAPQIIDNPEPTTAALLLIPATAILTTRPKHKLPTHNHYNQHYNSTMPKARPNTNNY